MGTIDVHENEAPAVLDDNVMSVVDPPEQIFCVGTIVTDGAGSTLIVSGAIVPGQPDAVGVTLKMTVPCDVPVLKSVCTGIELPDVSAVCPVIAADDTVVVQLYVVPVTLELRLMTMDWLPPHIS